MNKLLQNDGQALPTTSFEDDISQITMINNFNYIYLKLYYIHCMLRHHPINKSKSLKRYLLV